MSHLNNIMMKDIGTIFRFLCIVATICVCIWCTYEFSKDQDYSEISFVRFNENEISVYPQITLCIHDFSDSELKKINKKFNSSAYTDFLKGQLWDSRMANIDIGKVTLPWEVLDTCAKSSYFENCIIKADISTHVSLFGSTCVSLHYRSPKRIFEASMLINSSGNLKNKMQRKEFSVILSYPGQIYRGSTMFPGYTLEWDHSLDHYEMRFDVRDVEVIRRRNKRGHACVDSEQSDSITAKQLLDVVGCRPFYWHPLEEYPACNSKDEMALIFREYNEIVSDSPDLVRRLVVTPPCSEIQQMSVYYRQKQTNATIENRNFATMDKKVLEEQDWFRISVQFEKNTFKEIKQVRAYSAQTLIGNAGGYVGLLVGYTIAELPSLLGFLYRSIIGILQLKWF